MLNIFKLDQILFSKEINLKKPSDLIKLYALVITILVGLKYLTTLPSNPLAFKELVGLTLGFLGGFKIRRDTIPQKQVQMMTFFPKINITAIKKYYMYKKPILIYLTILYLLFPINSSQEEIQHFFFFLSVLMFMMFIDTLSGRLFHHSKLSDRINVAIRIAYFAIFSPGLASNLWGFDLDILNCNIKLEN